MAGEQPFGVLPDFLLQPNPDKGKMVSLCKNYALKNTIKFERALLDMTRIDLSQKPEVSRQSINTIQTRRFLHGTVLALMIAWYFKRNVNDIFELEKSN